MKLLSCSEAHTTKLVPKMSSQHLGQQLSSPLHPLGQLCESVRHEQGDVDESVGAVLEASLLSGTQASTRGVHARVPTDVVDLVNLEKNGCSCWQEIAFTK